MRHDRTDKPPLLWRLCRHTKINREEMSRMKKVLKQMLFGCLLCAIFIGGGV